MASATPPPPTWVSGAADLGELRAVADILGHSPEILLSVYAHALPASVRAVADRIGQRSAVLRTEPSGPAPA